MHYTKICSASSFSILELLWPHSLLPTPLPLYSDGSSSPPKALFLLTGEGAHGSVQDFSFIAIVNCFNHSFMFCVPWCFTYLYVCVRVSSTWNWVTDSCELPCGCQELNLRWAVCVFSCWAISPAPSLCFSCCCLFLTAELHHVIALLQYIT